MDSTDARPLGRCLLLTSLALPLLAWATTLPACAVPCVDDGLAQEFCPPEADASATGDDTGPTPGDGDGDNGDTQGCALLDVILIPQTPTMVLLVDQSGSMGADFGGDSRWNVITNVLIDPNDGVVPQFAGSIRFGLALYSGLGDMGECPTLFEVDPAIDNFPAIETMMSMSAPLQNTPTGESLELVWQKLDALDIPGTKYIVLATDGEPDTCAVPEPSNGQPEAVAAAEAAHAAGIDTFIISVGDDVGANHLQDMASAGQGDPNAEFYLALDQAALVTAFEEIIAGVRSCQLDLMTPLTPEDAGNCSVEVNGELVGLDDPNGWQLNDPNEMELLGAACEALQGGTSSVQMECSCDVG